MRSWLSLVVSLTIGLSAGRLYADPIEGSFDLIVITGDSLPGTDGAVSQLDGPVLNNHGSVAFLGASSGSVTTKGLYRADSAEMVPIAISGDLAPDGISTVSQFDSFDRGYFASLNDSGTVAFSSLLLNPASNTTSRSLLIGNGIDTAIVVREGQTVPGGNGVFADEFRDVRLNQAGQVAFTNNLDSTTGVLTGDQDVFLGDGTLLTAIFRSTHIDSDNNSSGPRDISLDDHGFVAFGFSEESNGIRTDSVVMSDGATIQVIATEPFLGPDGIAGSVSFSNSDGQAIVNNIGEVAFFTRIQGLPTNEDSVLYVGDGISNTLLAQEGTGLLTNSLSVGQSLAINDLGTVVFTTQAGVYMVNESGMQLILGDEALIAGGMQTSISKNNGNALNQDGQIAFITNFTEIGETLVKGEAIFFYDAITGIKEVVRTGDTYLSSTIDQLEFIVDNVSGEEATGFNDAGQVAFQFSLVDGRSGISVWTPDAPPITGDLNGDGFVGIDDLNIVLGNWNQNIPPGHPLADPSGDGFVGIDDLNTVLGNWNAGTPPGSQTVPEPASLGLLLIGGTALMRRIKPIN